MFKPVLTTVAFGRFTRLHGLTPTKFAANVTKLTIFAVAENVRSARAARSIASSAGRQVAASRGLAVGLPRVHLFRGIPVAISPNRTRRVAAPLITCGDAAVFGSAKMRCRFLGGGSHLLNLINYVKSFANQEEGQDLLEYALLVALIALIAIGAVGHGRWSREHRSSPTSRTR